MSPPSHSILTAIFVGLVALSTDASAQPTKPEDNRSAHNVPTASALHRVASAAHIAGHFCFQQSPRNPSGPRSQVYCADVAANTVAKPEETVIKKGKLLASDNFQSLDKWRVETALPDEVKARNGALEIDTSSGVTAWFETPLEGDVVIEYEATVIGNGGPNDRVSDLNCFWMASDPQSPNDFWKASEARNGDFGKYASLQLYYVGYGGHDNTKTRLRRYNGEPNPPIAAELSEPDQLIQPNHTYKIQLVRRGNSAQFWRDGEKLFDFTDPTPLENGYFGFRTLRNHVRFANLRVYRLEAK